MKRKILTGLAMTMMLNTVISVSASNSYSNIKDEQQILLESLDENKDTSEEIKEKAEEYVAEDIENIETDKLITDDYLSFEQEISTYSESDENNTEEDVFVEKPVTVWKIDKDESSGFTGMFENTAKVITKEDGTKAIKFTINTVVSGLELSNFKYSFDNVNFTEFTLTEEQEEYEIVLPEEYNEKENYLVYFGASYTAPVVGEMSHIARVIIGDNRDEFRIGTEKPVTVWKIDLDNSSGFTGMFEDTATVITKDNGTKVVKLTINTVVSGLELSNFKYSFDNVNFTEFTLTEEQEEYEIELPEEYNDKENYLIYFGASYTAPVVGEMSHVARVIIGNTSEFVTEDTGNDGGAGNTGSGGSTGSGSSSSGNTQQYEIANGKYTVDIYLYKDNLSELSMADSVLNRSAIIEANNGVYTISFSTKPMSFGNITDVLRDLLYLKDGSYVQADVIARNNAIGDETNLPSAFSFVLPSVSDYIPVKVTHPKVAGLGDEYLDAQLKIDWATLKSNSSAQLSTDITVSTANVEKVELTDEKTGIKINATADVIPTTSSIKVTTITDEEEYNKILEILGEDFERFIAHNINILENETDITINGNVKVSIPLPGGYSVAKLAIYRINSDGTKTIIKATVEDDLIVFETSSLGIFAIAQTLEEQLIEIEDLQDELSGEALMAQLGGFTDIENHWARESIKFVLENGIFIGTSDNTFSPNNAMTRGMLVEVIKRIENVEQSYKNAATSFEDISPSDYYFEAVIWANENGIVSGVSETEFAPNKAVTREEAIVIFERYLQYKEIDIKTIYVGITFNDEENISDWAINSVHNLTEADIIKGINGNFEPKSNMTRAEVATLIERLLKEYFGY